MTEKELTPTISRDPWSMTRESAINTAVDTHFDDNFTQLKDEESNENGLQLPESEHYLAVLERKLMRIQNKLSGKETSNKAQIKDILKALNAKRDALFQNDLPISSGTELDDLALTSNESVGKSSQMQAISSLITNTALFNVIEKKIAPQSQALDAEEVKKLLDADLLNLIKESEAENVILTSKDAANSEHDTK